MTLYLDGLEKFGRLFALKDIMYDELDFWNKSKDREWIIIVTRMDGNKIYCKMYQQDPGPNHNENYNSVNFMLLKILWTTCGETCLPEV